MKVCFITIDLEWAHGDDLRAVKRTDELVPADAQLALAGLDLVVLHPPGFIGYSAVDPLTLDGNRGGDVTHIRQ